MKSKVTKNESEKYKIPKIPMESNGGSKMIRSLKDIYKKKGTYILKHTELLEKVT